jgi:DNA-binding MarR family transcriptional regulator
MTADGKPRSPAAQVETGRSFFAGLDLQVEHFAAMWHTFNVGRLLANDLNAISAQHGISIADFHLLGAMMIDGERPLRATDLAGTLDLSLAVISERVTRLAAMALLQRQPSQRDRRTTLLTITPAGAAKVQAVAAALEAQARFVRHYQALPAPDRIALDRIMGHLHAQMHRDHAPVSR